MRIAIDENISTQIASAIRFLSLQTPNMQIDHVSDLYGPGVSDAEWIRRYSQSGGIYFISLDHGLNRSSAQRADIRTYGVVGVLLPKSACSMKLFEKAAFLIRWFPLIEAHFIFCNKKAIRGQLYQTGRSWQPSAGMIRQI